MFHGFEPRLGYLLVTYSLTGSSKVGLNSNWPDHRLSWSEYESHIDASLHDCMFELRVSLPASLTIFTCIHRAFTLQSRIFVSTLENLISISGLSTPLEYTQTSSSLFTKQKSLILTKFAKRIGDSHLL